MTLTDASTEDPIMIGCDSKTVISQGISTAINYCDTRIENMLRINATCINYFLEIQRYI